MHRRGPGRTGPSRVARAGVVAGILGSAVLVTACGNYSRIGWYEDVRLDVPVEIALRSTVLGVTPYRMRREVSVLCVGDVRRRNSPEPYPEIAAARMRWEVRLHNLVQGAAPEVLPAQLCESTDQGEHRVRDTERRALEVIVSPGRIEDGYVDISVATTIDRIRRGSVWFRLVQDANGWWVRDQRCNGGVFCEEFDFTQVLEGIPRGGDPTLGRTARD